MAFPEVVNMYNRDWERMQNPPREAEFIEPAEYGPANCPPCQMWDEVNRLMADFFYDKNFYGEKFYGKSSYGKRVCGKKFCVKKAGSGSPPKEPAPR
jgi:hypothetical protein